MSKYTHVFNFANPNIPEYMKRPSSPFMDATGMRKIDKDGKSRFYGAFKTHRKTISHNLDRIAL